jgi:hypothetical protein
MMKFKSSGGLSLSLMLMLLAPIAAIAQETPPADEPVSSTAADAGNDAAAAAEAPPTSETPAAPEALPAEQAAPAATGDSPSDLETLPKPFFKHPFFMLLVFIVLVALGWVLVRRSRTK